MGLFFPSVTTLSYSFTEPHYIHNGVSVYYLVSLNVTDNLIVNVTHGTEDGTGNFSTFIFNQRPTESFINFDNTLDPKIFYYAIDYSLDFNPFINYTALERRIHYIQVILLRNGPDLFLIQSNQNLTRYYLPVIPSFQISVLIPLLAGGLIALPVLLRKKVKILKE